MLRPFYSAPVRLRPEMPLMPGSIRLPPPNVLTAPVNREPPPPGAEPAQRQPATAAEPPQRQPAMTDEPATGAATSHSSQSRLPEPAAGGDRPWMTHHIVEEIRRRNHLQREADRSGQPQLRAAAEAARQRVNRLVGAAKERFCLAHPERTDEILATDRSRRPHHCSACDMNFAHPEQLEQHCQQHVRCGLDGCPFTANQKLVDKHISMQHDSGLARAIMSLNTPEAVERWRAERRARFCRLEAAQQRQQQQAERLARGIRLGVRQGRFPAPQERAGRGRGNRFMSAGGRGRGRGGFGRSERQRQPTSAPIDSDSDDGVAGGGLPPFAGIAAVSDASEESDSDSNAADQVATFGLCGDVERAIDARPVVIGTGSEVAGADGNNQKDETQPDSVTDSMSNGTEQQSGANGDIPVSTVHLVAGSMDQLSSASTVKEPSDVVEPISKQDSPTCADDIKKGDISDGKNRRRPRNRARKHRRHSEERADAGDGTGCPHAADPVSDGAAPPTGRPRHQPRGGEPQQAKRRRRRPLTLLEKLLAGDIQRERNVLLQCVRYCCQRQFFDSAPAPRRRQTQAAPAQDVRVDDSQAMAQVEATSMSTADSHADVAHQPLSDAKSSQTGALVLEQNSEARIHSSIDKVTDPVLVEGNTAGSERAEHSDDGGEDRPGKATGALGLLGAYDSDEITDSE